MQENQNKSEAFVSYVIRKVASDTAARAAFARGDNPDTAYLAWEYLVSWCDIADLKQCKAYALIAAAIAREQISSNGKMNVGECLRAVVTEPGDLENSPEKARLMRLLACDTGLELVELLRSIIRYLQGKEGVRLNYAQTLDDILWWCEKRKVNWSKAFFKKYSAKTDIDEAGMNASQQKETE